MVRDDGSAASPERSSDDDSLLSLQYTDEFTQFVHQHGARLVRIAEAALCDHGWAEDVVQDTMICVWQRWSTARVGGLPYVKAALGNMIVDEYRRIARRPQEAQWEHDDAFPVHPDDHVAELDAALRLMSVLPVQQRLVLALREMDEQSVKQTAQILGCSTGTVKSQHSRARKTLARHLAVSEDLQVRELMSRMGHRS